MAGEILYPTVGMVLCNHHDLDYKQACMEAYNRWIAEYCAAASASGCSASARRRCATPRRGSRICEQINALGLRGVMLPGVPQHDDYDHPIYDPFWEAAVDLGLPLSFHILTTRVDRARARSAHQLLRHDHPRPTRTSWACSSSAASSSAIPHLRIVCVEADAGWVPHYMYRMDHYYERHRYWLPAGTLSQRPSEYFREHIYVTFQDDWVGVPDDAPAQPASG